MDISGWYRVNENLIYKYEHWSFEFFYIPWIFLYGNDRDNWLLSNGITIKEKVYIRVMSIVFVWKV